MGRLPPGNHPTSLIGPDLPVEGNYVGEVFIVTARLLPVDRATLNLLEAQSLQGAALQKAHGSLGNAR
jgi:hypothetical protein